MGVKLTNENIVFKIKGGLNFNYVYSNSVFKGVITAKAKKLMIFLLSTVLILQTFSLEVYAYSDNTDYSVDTVYTVDDNVESDKRCDDNLTNINTDKSSEAKNKNIESSEFVNDLEDGNEKNIDESSDDELEQKN